MNNIDNGLSAWKMNSNHNNMIELQSNSNTRKKDDVEIAFYGSSAFKITTPNGLSIMVDPWRNHPARGWDWYFNDFPLTKVDIGVSTHAHYDHDALHRLDANVILDRLIGKYEFSDVKIYGIADKHSTDGCCSLYDYKKVMREIHGVNIEPPNNPRSWDNCIIVIETAGIRIAHWGDNRSDLPEGVWEKVGKIDIALLPIDDSEHVMGFSGIDDIINRLQPKIIIPHHYYIWDVMQRQSTLLNVNKWIESRENVNVLNSASISYNKSNISRLDKQIHFFGDNVMFDKKAWRENG